MKIIHLSDLHLGKRVHEFSMLDDQRYILKQILEHVAEEHPDVVILAENNAVSLFIRRKQCSYLTGFYAGLRSRAWKS